MLKIKSVITALLIILVFSSCGRNSDESLYKEAKLNIEEEKFSDAIEKLNLLLSEYPESNYLAVAKFELGKLYYGHVLPRMSREETIKKAIEFYSDVESNYPDSAQAASSLFMVAFLQANELGNLDAARNIYENFLTRYPNHELAVSVKAELINLGKTPEEILQEKLSKSE